MTNEDEYDHSDSTFYGKGKGKKGKGKGKKGKKGHDDAFKLGWQKGKAKGKETSANVASSTSNAQPSTANQSPTPAEEGWSSWQPESFQTSSHWNDPWNGWDDWAQEAQAHFTDDWRYTYFVEEISAPPDGRTDVSNPADFSDEDRSQEYRYNGPALKDVTTRDSQFSGQNDEVSKVKETASSDTPDTAQLDARVSNVDIPTGHAFVSYEHGVHQSLLCEYIDMHKHPTYVILDSGCTRAMGSRYAVDRCRAAWQTSLRFLFDSTIFDYSDDEVLVGSILLVYVFLTRRVCFANGKYSFPCQYCAGGDIRLSLVVCETLRGCLYCSLNTCPLLLTF